MTSEDSEVVDLYAICARASASPAGDLRPPDLSRIAPPCTTDISADGDRDPTLTGMLRKPRIRLALAGAAGALLLLGLLIGLGSSSAPPRKAVTASAAPAAPPPPAETVEAPPALLAAPIKLPPPPTTGAPATPAPPSRAVAMRKAPAAPVAAGPKMTKIRSDGSAVR